MMLLSRGCVLRIVSRFQTKRGRSLTAFPAEEERSQRRGCSDNLVNAIPPRSDTSDATGTLGAVDGAAPPINASPTSNEEPSQSPIRPPSSPPEITAEAERQSSPTLVAEHGRPPAVGPVTKDNAESGHQPTASLVAGDDTESGLRPSGDAPPPPPTTSTHEDSPTGTNQPERFTALSVTTGAFKFDEPSSFITPSTIGYWETIPGGQGWIDMVKAYLQLEQTPTPQGVRLCFLFWGRIHANDIKIGPSPPPNSVQTI